MRRQYTPLPRRRCNDANDTRNAPLRS